jgi:hypothetical protein
MFWVFYLSPNLQYVLSSLAMWPKSNNIVVFALDLKSTNEGEYVIFGLLSLANIAQNDVLQFHSFICE